MSTPPAPARTLSEPEIQALQKNLHDSIATTQKAAGQCSGADQTTLQNQAQAMADQEAELETTLFAEETADVSAETGQAFDGAASYTSQLAAMAQNLGQTAKIVNLASQVVGAVAQLIKLL